MKNNFNKKILVIHAHPDDTEIFCAGTLKLLKDIGYEIIIATMTAGGMGGINSTENATIKIRKSEAEKAAGIIGAKYYCLDQKDGYLFDNEKIRTKTIELIRKINPGIVLTHLPNDYHSDHRTTSNIVEIAAMLSTLPNINSKIKPLNNTPLLYHTSPFGFTDPIGSAVVKPHFFVDISTVIDIKMKMLEYHKSQIELMRVMHNIDSFFEEMKSYNIMVGKMAGFKYAEAFWQHLGGGFQKVPLIQTELKKYMK